jgi:hypothetical protein
MTDMGVKTSYKDVTDGWTIGHVRWLSDVTDRFFEYFLEYARICSNML